MAFTEKGVLVVGLGRSGLAAARWLLRQGARVTVSDVKPESELDRDTIGKLAHYGARLETGGHREASFLGADLIVVSPGVPLNIAPLEAARNRGIPVWGELELASRVIDVPMVAVTGTNGKSTVTALLGEMIRGAGASVFVGGNIGTPLMDCVLDGVRRDYAVVEVSSFQLDTVETFHPQVSLLLNIAPDHLDRYRDYEAYAASKLRIFENQGEGQATILNDDDPRLAVLRPQGGMDVWRYGREKRPGRQAYLEEDRIHAAVPGREAAVFPLGRFRLPGRHNRENLMAALLAGLHLGLDPAVLHRTVERFRGLPHRLEWVAQIRGIDFYNDSKATNVAAAVRSVAGFDRSVVLIAGGRHKGADYGPLVEAAGGRVKHSLFLGESRDLLARAFRGVTPYTLVESLEEAVRMAHALAEPGEVVLLAPACSSFDMFSDYAHRGDAFKEAVRELDNA